MVPLLGTSSRQNLAKPAHYLVCDQRVGAACNVFITTTYAYAISRVPLNTTGFFTVFHSLVCSLVQGWFQAVADHSTLAVEPIHQNLIIPMLLSPFNIILMRTAFFKRTIPEAISRSRSDRWGKWNTVFWYLAIVSTQGLRLSFVHCFRGSGNDWFHALLYIKKWQPLPIAIPSWCKSKTIWITSLKTSQGISQLAGLTIPRETGRMATE